jgi:hypothetical protein
MPIKATGTEAPSLTVSNSAVIDSASDRLPFSTGDAV